MPWRVVLLYIQLFHQHKGKYCSRYRIGNFHQIHASAHYLNKLHIPLLYKLRWCHLRYKCMCYNHVQTILVPLVCKPLVNDKVYSFHEYFQHLIAYKTIVKTF